MGGSSHRARSLARRLALQALYQIQMNPRSWQDVQLELAADPEADRVDMDYFRGLIAAIAPSGVDAFEAQTLQARQMAHARHPRP